MSDRLSLASLASVPASARPPLDPRAVRTGVVHLGIGAFARAHQAVVLERCMVNTGDLGWGMVGVSQRSAGAAEALDRQDGLFSVQLPSATVVGSVRGAYFAGHDPARVVADLAAPSTRLVTVTVTEKGYRYRPGQRSLDTSDAAVRADLAGAPPRTVVGQLAAGLHRRRTVGAPLTVLSCDNLPANGQLLAGLVNEFLASAGDEATRSWVASRVRFPDTVVDRMVPSSTPDVLASAHRQLGVADECALVTEPYLEWVIDDSVGLAPLAAGGAVLSRQTQRYAQRKLRVLNAAHSALCWWGVLAGHRFVADVVADETIAERVRSMLLTDVLPFLSAPEGTELTEYLDSVFSRCANPLLCHATRQVCADGSLKVGPRLLDTAAEALRANHLPGELASAVAGWLRCTRTGTDHAGRPLRLADPAGASVRATPDTEAALGLVHPEVAAYREFVAEVDRALRS